MLSNTDVQTAIPAITEILKREDPAAVGEPVPEPKAPEAPQRAQDDEPEEIDEVESGADDGDDIDLDEEDTGREEPAKPAVPAPSSFTAEEKELFASLPPNLQEAVARRERERTKELHRAQKEKADALKSIETEKASLTAAQTQLSQQMARYGNDLYQKFQKDFGDVTDIAALGRDDPVRAAQMSTRILEIQAYENQKRVVEEQEARESATKLQTFRQEQNALLREQLKLDSDEKFNKFDAEITEFLEGMGVPRDRIARADASELSMAYDAMRYRKAVAKRKSTEKTKEVPQYVKPGNKSDISANDMSRAASMKRLKKSGSIKDAAAVFKGILS